MCFFFFSFSLSFICVLSLHGCTCPLNFEHSIRETEIKGSSPLFVGWILYLWNCHLWPIWFSSDHHLLVKKQANFGDLNFVPFSFSLSLPYFTVFGNMIMEWMLHIFPLVFSSLSGICSMTGLLSWRQWLIASSICAKNFSMLYVPEVSLYKAPFTIPLVLSFWMDLYHFYFFIFYALHFWGQPLPSSFFNSFSLSFWMDLYHYCCTCYIYCVLLLYYFTVFTFKK